VEFKKTLNFSELSISKSASFTEAIFYQEVDLYRSQFGNSNLNDASEENERIGDEAESEGRGYTSFDGAIFQEKVTFSEVHFWNELSFNGAVFNKQTEFIGLKSDMFDVVCDFGALTLPEDGDFVFEKVNLSKVKFHNTNLEKIVFRDVHWGTGKTRLQKFFRGNSYILWDEIRPSEGWNDWIDDSKTAENYRQLVLNYESKRDFATAEYFHIGEMEMLRKKVGDLVNYNDYKEPSKFRAFLNRKLKFHYISNLWCKIRKYLNSYGLYWLSSRYGTSFVQALIVLVLLVCSFSFLFLLTGFKSSKENTVEPNRVVEYNLLPDSNHVVPTFSRFISDFIESVSYTLSIVTFQKERFYEPLGWQSRFLLYLAVFTLTAQAALVLLAIRRRFKR
jgi:hypothetical protein